MKYEVGDKVRARADLQSNTRYGRTTVTASMKKLRGTTLTISRVNQTAVGTFIYNVEETGGLWWTNEMFTRKSYTPDELFDALLRGAIDEEAYNKMLEEA